MVDHLGSVDRSNNMQAIKSTDSAPEMTVRRIIHGMGYRYRLHAKHLPGKPDLVFGPRRKVIFVHGCFWHQHAECKVRPPKSNSAYWIPKLARNQARDAAARSALAEDGWDVLTVWECETKGAALPDRIRCFLDRSR